MPVALGWLSLSSGPFCHSAPFAPVHSVAHNGLLILFERVGGTATPVYMDGCRGVDQTGQPLPDTARLFPSGLPKLPPQDGRAVTAGAAEGPVGRVGTTAFIPGQNSNKRHFTSLRLPPVHLGHIWYYSSTRYLYNPPKQRSLSQMVFMGSGVYFHFAKYICSI